MKQMIDRRSFLISTAYYVVLLGLFWLTLKYLLPIVLPFIIAFIIAALLQKPIGMLQKRMSKLPQWAVSGGVALLFLATIGTAAVLLIGALIRETADFLMQIPSMLEGLLPKDEQSSYALPEFMGDKAQQLLNKMQESLPGLLSSAADGLSSYLAGTVSTLGEAAFRLPSLLFSVLITAAAIFFISVDYSGTLNVIRSICPAWTRSRLSEVKSCSASTVIKLAKTYAFLMLLTCTELSVGFWLINMLGADIAYIVPLAVIISVVDILPVVGVGTVLLPWAAYDLFTGNATRGVMLLVLYAIIAVVRNFLEPKLIGTRFGMHPAVTLLAIYSGGKLFGFIGALALPLSIIVLKQLRSGNETTA